MKKITAGEIDRTKKESAYALDRAKRAKEKQAQKVQEDINNTTMGLFKKDVIKTLVEIFSNNYGKGFDYNTLISSIKFSNKKDKNGNIILNYDLKEDNIVFESDAKKECKEFNENSYSDFISNEDVINGNNVNRYYFNNSEEYEAYENSDIFDDDFDDYDGQFITIDDNKSRYGEFNKINKLAGYTPVNIASKEAKNKISKLWNLGKGK